MTDESIIALALWKSHGHPPDLFDGEHSVFLSQERDACFRDARAVLGVLKFYADEISYVPTQMKEPRTAVHGDGGKKARTLIARIERQPTLDEKETDNG